MARIERASKDGSINRLRAYLPKERLLSR